MLRQKSLSLSLGESCTGGLLADAFVGVAGASDVFLGCLLCYALEAKVAVAGVSKESVYDNFAVNESCSREFALASLAKFSSDYALSTTGFAENTKEMYLTIASKGRVETYKEIFFGERNQIRQAQVEYALARFSEFLGEDF